VPTPPQRTQRERVEESSRRLAEAAIELIAENGYAFTTAKDIGLRAGYSRALVTQRFGSKDALLDFVLTQYYERRLIETNVSGSSGLQQVLAPIDALRSFAAEEPQTLRAMFVLNFEAVHNTDVLRDRITLWIRRFREQLVTSVIEGQQDGSIRSDVVAEQVSADVIALGIGHAYAWVVMPDDYDFESTLMRYRTEVAQWLEPQRH